MAASDPNEQPPKGAAGDPQGADHGWSRPPGGTPARPPKGRRRGCLWGCLGILAVVVIIVVTVVATNSGDKTSTPTKPAPAGSGATSSQPSSAGKDTPRALPAIRLTGRGKQASPTFTVTDGLAVFHSTCSSCAANFAVELLDSSGQTKDLLVNNIGTYDGSKAEGLDAGRYRLNVTADTAWSVTVTQPRHASPAALPHAYAGKGDQVKGPFHADHAVKIQGTNRGQGNFAVEVLDADGALQDLPFNEIGTFHGSAVSQMINGGPYYINVASDGTWKLQLSKP
ncbi:hypothetical protein [Streptomyces spinosirectus]